MRSVASLLGVHGRRRQVGRLLLSLPSSVGDQLKFWCTHRLWRNKKKNLNQQAWRGGRRRRLGQGRTYLCGCGGRAYSSPISALGVGEGEAARRLVDEVDDGLHGRRKAHRLLHSIPMAADRISSVVADKGVFFGRRQCVVNREGRNRRIIFLPHARSVKRAEIPKNIGPRTRTLVQSRSTILKQTSNKRINFSQGNMQMCVHVAVVICLTCMFYKRCQNICLSYFIL
jgi:hypothetical protein